MIKERLLRLADLLEADAANPTGIKFNIGTWAAKDGYDADAFSMDNVEFQFDLGQKTIPVDCNTVACAVGLAAISGVFAAEGLGWELRDQGEAHKGVLVPTFEGKNNFDAVQDFFDIDYRSVYHLFTSEGYEDRPDVEDGKLPLGAAGELIVAKQIREFVANDGMT